MIAGLVLAGGRSTRFGSEKAVALVQGRPMLAHVLVVLGNGCGALAVNAPVASGAADYARACGLTLLPDPEGAADGPLTGVLEGLRWAERVGADLLLTAPCDTPWLPSDMVAKLVGGLGDSSAAVAVTTEGSHPLCAVWRTRLRPALEAELALGHPSVRVWLSGVGASEVVFHDAASFKNMNSPGPSA